MKTKKNERSELAGKRLYNGKKMVAAYVTPETAERFSSLAASRNMKPGRLLSLLIQSSTGQLKSQDGAEHEQYPEEEKKTHAVTAHITRGEAMRLSAEAERHGMRNSPFVNLILRGAITQSISLSEVEIDEIRKVRAELAKVGTNLNQAVKLMRANPYGNCEISPEMLKELSNKIGDVRENIKIVLQSNLATWANLKG